MRRARPTSSNSLNSDIDNEYNNDKGGGLVVVPVGGGSISSSLSALEFDTRNHHWVFTLFIVGVVFTLFCVVPAVTYVYARQGGEAVVGFGAKSNGTGTLVRGRNRGDSREFIDEETILEQVRLVREKLGGEEEEEEEEEEKEGEEGDRRGAAGRNWNKDRSRIKGAAEENEDPAQDSDEDEEYEDEGEDQEEKQLRLKHIKNKRRNQALLGQEEPIRPIYNEAVVKSIPPPGPLTMEKALETLETSAVAWPPSMNSRIVYNAGLPRFPRVFSRDGIIASLLFDNPRMLRDQLDFSLLTQGKVVNSFTGEEVGKIVHEYPGYPLRGFNTDYNACDTTALYIIGIHHLLFKSVFDETELGETKEDFYNRHASGLKKAIHYIQSHLDERGLFVDDPKFAGAQKFALRVTYWKDSEVIERPHGEPQYPVVYTLAHIQNLDAIRKAAILIPTLQEHLHELSTKMLQGLLSELVVTVDEKKVLAVGLDSLGKWVPPSIISPDVLHGLYYLHRDDLPQEIIDAVVESSKQLETPIGYISALIPLANGTAKMSYHGSAVWPFENAMIHAGASKFKLTHVMEASAKSFDVIQNEYYEYFSVEKTLDNTGEVTWKQAGCHTQLWSIAAHVYFKRALAQGN